MILILAQVTILLYMLVFEELRLLSIVLTLVLFSIYCLRYIESKVVLKGPILVPVIKIKKITIYFILSVGVYILQNFKMVSHYSGVIVSCAIIIILLKSRVKNDI